MQRTLSLLTLLGLAACSAGYTGAGANTLYDEPAQYVYVMPMDRAVLVTRDVLVDQGWSVYRVQRSGSSRIIWARHGDDDVVRIYATPRGDRIALHGLHEIRERHGHDRGRHRGWVQRGAPRGLLAAIDTRLRGH